MPTQVAIALIVALSIVLMLARPRGIAEAWWVGGGCLSLLALRLITASDALRAVAKGADVYLFLLGMMLLSELARVHGVFDWVAATAVRLAAGSEARLFLLVYAFGTLVTIFMSNDATAVVLTPAILNAVRRAKVPPQPCLFACAFIANAASFVLPVSNPANLVVFARGTMPPLAAWLASFGMASLLSITATYCVLRLYFRPELRGTLQGGQEESSLGRNGRLVAGGLAVTSAVLLTASATRHDLGLPAFLSALAVTAAVSIRSRTSPVQLAKQISWSTLGLVAGLFILVDAVEQIGALRYTQAAVEWVQTLPRLAGALVAGFSIGVGNNLINNLPMGLLAGAAAEHAHLQGLLRNAVLIGVDLGPNLSVTGSLATILWLLAIRREGLNVGFRDFLKVGAIAMPVAMLAALLGAALTSRFTA